MPWYILLMLSVPYNALYDTSVCAAIMKILTSWQRRLYELRSHLRASAELSPPAKSPSISMTTSNTINDSTIRWIRQMLCNTIGCHWFGRSQRKNGSSVYREHDMTEYTVRNPLCKIKRSSFPTSCSRGYFMTCKKFCTSNLNQQEIF